MTLTAWSSGLAIATNSPFEVDQFHCRFVGALHEPIGTDSGRTVKYPKQWLATTGWESNLTLALGYSGASQGVQGMCGCRDITTGFSLMILFGPVWHSMSCYTTVAMKNSGQVLVFHHRRGQISSTLLSRNICSVVHCHTNQYVLVLYYISSYPLRPLEQGLMEWPSTCCIIPCMCNVLNKYCHWNRSVS